MWPRVTRLRGRGLGGYGGAGSKVDLFRNTRVTCLGARGSGQGIPRDPRVTWFGAVSLSRLRGVGLPSSDLLGCSSVGLVIGSGGFRLTCLELGVTSACTRALGYKTVLVGLE